MAGRKPARGGHAARLPRGQGDIGPPERYRHGDLIRTEPGAEAGVFHRRVSTQSGLDRYLRRGQISQRQFDAGLKLYRMWRASGSAQCLIGAYGIRVQARRELSEEQAALRHRVTEVLRRMGRLSGILVHVCLCDEAARDWAVARGDAPQAGVVVLRLALDALADYWKL
ncbi:MAG: DUF6456 domain-containing protein [Kiloniellaceae bacterium]